MQDRGFKMTASKTSPFPAGKLSGLRVLVAEDNWVNADTMSVILEEEGATVVGPSSTAAASIELVRTEATDFALVDMSLSDAFADSLAAELKQRSIPFAIITAYRTLPTDADAHAEAVLHKPVSAKAIVDVISRWQMRRSQ